MRKAADRVVLVTGASSGIGLACASLLAARGFRVYGTSRSGTHAGAFAMLSMDVTDEGSVERAVDEVLRREGRLDVAVNNAGVALAGPVECTSIHEAQVLFDTNFFGALRVCRAVLPAMRTYREGYIVNIGSIAGLVAVPHQALYSASKFALEGLSEALRLEVGGFGVRVVLLEPGDHRTRMTENRVFAAGARTAEAYALDFECAVGRMATDEQGGPDPAGIARLLHRVITTAHPRLRYTAGPGMQRAATWAKRLLPYSFTETSVARYYGLR